MFLHRKDQSIQSNGMYMTYHLFFNEIGLIISASQIKVNTQSKYIKKNEINNKIKYSLGDKTCDLALALKCL